MKQPIDIIPEYIRQRYPSHQALMEAMTRGEVMRDGYGNIVLRDQPPMTNTQCFPPNYGYYPAMQSIYQGPVYQNACGYCPVYCAQPMIERSEPSVNQSLVEFDMFNIEGVRCYYKEESDGYLLKLVSAYDVAVGIGLSRERLKTVLSSADMSAEKTYSYDGIRWKEFNDYAQQRLPYLQGIAHPSIFAYVPSQIGNESFIPLEVAVQVAMCCRSEQAKKFQAIIAVKISDELYNLNVEKHRKIVEELQGKINSRDRQIAEQNRVTEHITNYYQQFNSTKHCFTATELAKNYGLSAKTFNKLLHRLHMIYFVNGTWQVYQKYIDLGCTTIRNENGQSQTYLTENGKLVISALLINYGIEEGKPNQELVDRLIED